MSGGLFPELSIYIKYKMYCVLSSYNDYIHI